MATREDHTSGGVEVRPLIAAAAAAGTEGLRRACVRQVPLGKKARQTRAKLVEREFRRGQRAGAVPSTTDPWLLARALTAMVDRYCYLTYVFDPPEAPVDIDESVDVLAFVWNTALGLA